MSILSRIAKKLTARGESFLINGTTPAVGFFRALDSGTLHTYLDDTEAMTVAKPGLYLVTLPDTPIDVDDTVTRDGRVYSVRKVGIERFMGAAVVKIAVLA